MKVTGKTSATLLVPRKYMVYFSRRVKNSGSTAIYFNFLVNRYFLSRSKSISRYNKSYQSKSLDLMIVNFRPDYSDWVKIGTLSDYSRISRTAIFVMMLEWEMKGQNRRVHTIFQIKFDITYSRNRIVSNVDIHLRL